MLKMSKKVALLAVCVMVFGVVQPAFAWGNRTGSREGDAVAYGAGAGTVAAGVAAGILIFCTGSLATPFVVGAAAVAGAAGAAGGAYYGYNVEEKSLAKDAAVIAGAGAGGAVVGVATPVVAPIIGEVAAGGTIAGGSLASQQKSSSNGYSHTPINEHGGTWSGERGNSNWVMDENTVPANKLYNPDKLTWNETNAKYRNDLKNIPYKNGEPDFSAVSVGTVKINNFTSSRPDNFRNADKIFADKLNRENNLNLSAKDIAQFRKDNNLTWHERSDMGTMELVPREYHSLPHSGGISNVNK